MFALESELELVWPKRWPNTRDDTKLRRLVGRTGSGKSSLVLSLLRCINTEGSVLYNGIPTHSMPVDQLRSGITVIPQAVSS